jgi:hypothetical protein
MSNCRRITHRSTFKPLAAMLSSPMCSTRKGSSLKATAQGFNFVDIFSSSGRLLERLERGGWLNAPWGLALAPLDFGRFSKVLPIGRFAGTRDTESGSFTAAYDLAPGKAA